MRIGELSVEAALASLGSVRHGLAQAGAGRRCAEYGPNRLERIEREPLALRFVRQFTHFFALILWVAAGLGFDAEHYDPGTGMALLGTAILGVIAVNGVFSFWQEYRAERAIEALARLLPLQSTVLRSKAMGREAYYFEELDGLGKLDVNPDKKATGGPEVRIGE